jgi:hypothetical protein
MATKESHEYNVIGMTFTLKGNLYTLSAHCAELNESEKRALLIGAMNMAQDSYANLAKDKGFTDEQRAERAQETIDAINSGTYRKERAERVTTQKTGEGIAAAASKFFTNKYDEITDSELALMKKFMPEQAKMVEAWRA